MENKKLWTVCRSNGWKEVIDKEAKTKQRWTDKYAKERNEEENQLLFKTMQKEQQERKKKQEFQKKALKFFGSTSQTPTTNLYKTSSLASAHYEPDTSLKCKASAELQSLELGNTVGLNEEEEEFRDKLVLYDGVSKEGRGRVAYLNKRKEKSPSRKYRSPVTSSQEVGWMCEGVRSERPRHGRQAIAQSSFYSMSRDGL